MRDYLYRKDRGRRKDQTLSDMGEKKKKQLLGLCSMKDVGQGMERTRKEIQTKRRNYPAPRDTG